MDIVQFVQRMLRETAETRLIKHCHGMSVALTAYRADLNPNADLGERTSSIFLSGPIGRIGIKIHFDVGTAVSWAALASEKSIDDVDDPGAIDFMREYSNLHAGHLRGLLESVGAKFGMSLPFITVGEAEVGVSRVSSGAVPVALDAWILTDGELQVICSSEVEIVDRAALQLLQPALEAALVIDTAKSLTGENDGEVEFLL